MTIRLIILITIFFIVLGWALGRASADVPTLKQAQKLTKIAYKKAQDEADAWRRTCIKKHKAEIETNIKQAIANAECTIYRVDTYCNSIDEETEADILKPVKTAGYKITKKSNGDVTISWCEDKK